MSDADGWQFTDQRIDPIVYWTPGVNPANFDSATPDGRLPDGSNGPIGTGLYAFATPVFDWDNSGTIDTSGPFSESAGVVHEGQGSILRVGVNTPHTLPMVLRINFSERPAGLDADALDGVQGLRWEGNALLVTLSPTQNQTNPNTAGHIRLKYAEESDPNNTFNEFLTYTVEAGYLQNNVFVAYAHTLFSPAFSNLALLDNDTPAAPGDLPDAPVWDAAAGVMRNGTDQNNNDSIIGVTAGHPDFLDYNGDGTNDNRALQGTGGAERIHGLAGDDYILGNGGADFLYGDEGEDWIAVAGSDATASVFLDGGSGGDVLIGGDGADYLRGGADDITDTDDALQGGAGDDRIDGGGGNDVLFGGAGRDLLSGGEGDDHLRGASTGTPLNLNWSATPVATNLADSQVVNGAYVYPNTYFNQILGSDNFADTAGDVLLGGAGRDHLEGAAGADYLDGGSEDDILHAHAGNDVLLGGAGADWLNGGFGHDQLFGGEGNDRLFGDLNDPAVGQQGNDVLDGGAGNDFLYGHGGNDTYIFGRGYGQDTLDDTAGTDIIRLGAGIVTPFTSPFATHWGLNILRDGNNLLLQLMNGGTPSGDQLTLLNWRSAANRIEYLQAEDGTIVDVTAMSQRSGLGTDGADTLAVGFLDGYWFSQQTGTLQSFLLEGGAGDDTYLLSLGEGVNAITDTVSPGEGNRIAFGPGITPDAIRLGLGSLLIRYGDQGDAVHVTPFDPNNARNPLAVSEFLFDDGTVWTYDQLIDLGFDIDGTAGDDALTGTNVVDRFTGGAGNDTLDGGAGDDTYVFNPGDGRDIVTDEAGADTLAFGPGIDAGSVQLSLAVDGVATTAVLRYGTQGDAITLGSGLDAIETFQFDDGTVTTLADQIAAQGGLTITAVNPVYNLVIGSRYADNIAGASDVDQVYAGDGNDVIHAGAGDDDLHGEGGDDTYVFNLGDGQDVIVDREGANAIRFGAGIAPHDVYFAPQYHYDDQHVLQVSVGGLGDRLLIAGGLATGAIARYEFADGSTFGQDDLVALNGGLPGAPSPGQLVDTTDGFPITPGQAGQAFSGYGGDYLVGTDGDDEFYDDDDDGEYWYIGRRGNDQFNADAGTFNYIFNLGDGHDEIDGATDSVETVIFGGGITPDDVRLESVYSPYWWAKDLMIHYGNQGDGIQAIRGRGNHPIEYFRFANGESFTLDALIARNGITETGTPQFGATRGELTLGVDDPGGAIGANNWGTNANLSGRVLYGDDTYNEITGTAGNDAVYGAAGNDDLDGGAGNDFIFGEAGSDYLIGGDGNDAIYGGANNDDLYGEVGNDLLFGEAGSDYLIGGDGDDYVDGGAGDDSLYGDAGNDTLFDLQGDNGFEGGPGNDVIVGGPGWDGYFYNVGDGLDRLRDLGTLGVERDFVFFGAGILKDRTYARLVETNGELTAEIRFVDAAWNPMADAGIDLVLRPAGYAPDAPWDNFAIQQYYFADNSTVDFAYLLNNYPGTAGADLLIGGPDADTFSAGPGNDTLTGGAGDDTYYVNPGDGVDTIDDLAAPGAGNRIVFGVGITPGNLSLGIGSLLIRYGDQDAIHLANFDRLDPYGPRAVETFEFADGTVLTHNQLIDRGFDLAGTAGDDIVEGTNAVDRIFGGVGGDALAGLDGDDFLYGEAGDDTLHGGAGHDVLHGGSGNDSLLGGLGSDTYLYNLGEGSDLILELESNPGDIDRVRFGAGIDAAGLTVTRAGYNGNDLRLAFAGSNDTLTLMGWFNPEVSGQVEEFRFDDGSVLNAAQIEDLINSAPVVANAPADQAVAEDAAVSLTVPADAFVDPDNDVLSYSATRADGSALPAWLAFDATTRAFTGTPANGDVGALDIRVTASDGQGESASSVFTLTVQNVNDAPLVASPLLDQTAPEDSAFSFTVPATAFTDDDVMHGDALSFSAALADGTAPPSWLSFDAATRTFGGTPANEHVGSLEVRVTATDAAGASASDTFTLTVANTNDAPTIATAIADQAATEDQPFTFQIPPGSFADVDAGDVLTYSATLADGSVLPAWLSFDASTRTFSGTPTNGDVGLLNLRVTATDSAGASVAESFALTVANVNDAPVLANAIADQSSTRGLAFTYQVSDNAFADDDSIHGDGLVYGATLADGSSLPAWLGFDAATRTFSGTPGTGDVGSLAILVTATDSGGVTATDSFVLTVNPGTIYGTEGDDLLIGTPVGEEIYGYGGNDVLLGRAGNDALDGGAGADLLDGEEGDDTLQYAVDGTWSAGYLAVNLGSPGHAGSGLAVDLTGRSRSFDVYRGGAGIDTLLGTAGDDVIFLDDAASPAPSGATGPRLADIEIIATGDGNDIVDLTSPTYAYGDVTIDGGAGDDILWASSGNDSLLGGDGGDVLDGGAGADAMAGGSGDDFYFVDDAGDTVIEYSGEGTDTIVSTITYTLGDHQENLALWGSTAINGTGNSLNNLLAGYLNSAANVLAGGAGDDTYFVSIGDTAVELAGEGNDTIVTDVSWTLGANLENLVLEGSAAINGTGNALNNTLDGTRNAAANVLAGGAGDDVYLLGAGDRVVEATGAGVDTVQAGFSYTLGGNLENLTLIGTANINATGNTLANVLTGNSGNNTLNGGTGADTMRGGLGDDTYTVDNTGDVVTENAGEGTDKVNSSVTHTLTSNVENLTLTGTSALSGTGNDLDNILTGNSGNNTLTGGLGNDTLDGGSGSDTMRGGTGNDTYAVNATGDVVTENAGEGTDTVKSSIAYTLGSNVENLTLTGTSTINGTGNTLDNVLTGNSANNILTGNAGNDTLDGGTGSDTLRGGTGNDSYVVNSTGDIVTENAGEGTDTVNSSITYTLGSNVENLILTGTGALNATGNTLNNILTGNAGNNTLTGNAGNDTLDGGLGTDTLNGGTGNDTYVFNRGYGQDLITDTDTTAGNTDTARLGVNTLDTVFTQSGNNLEISLHGGTDKLTVQNWYTGSQYQTEVIQASDGSTLAASQVNQLIQAMATFSANNGGMTWDQAIDQNPSEVQAVLTAYWQPASG